ncbi:MAG: hypothetical protein DHS20C14_11720 [Phycisphaeraceae bacterium]|nr:MAG: hypothetical protein DHS20C14_11720 [Phycisphaeraceae bacterium]
MRALGLCVLCCVVPSVLAETPPPTGDAGYNDAGATIFLDNELTQVTVTLDPQDLLDMLADPFDETYRPCTVHIVNSQIDEMVLDVAIRPRGNTSLAATKKSWKLKFNEFVPGREIHGLEKFNLNGHQNDPSVIRGKLAWDIYNAFGVPSPRASMVRLIFNDGALVDDVYANVEQIDDEFLTAWFGTDLGNLYQCGYKGARADLRFVLPGDANAYATLGSPTYELEEDSGANQHADLADFIAFIETADDATFATDLPDWFGVDNFLRSLAVDCVNGHWDNYWYGANNFFLYAHPDSGRIEYIPYDLDNTYGIDFFSTDWAERPALSFGDGGFGWDFGSAFGGGAEPPLARRVLAVPAWRDQYLRYVRELVGAVGDPAEPVPTVYADTAGDTFLGGAEPHFDILSVSMANDQTDLLAEVTVAGPIDVGGGTDEARIVFFFDTRPGGSTSNPWGRAINTPVNADYFLGSWTDSGGGFLLYEWTGGAWDLLHASFNNPGGISQDLSSKTDGVARYTVPLAALGLTDTSPFDFDAVTTNDRGGPPVEPGIDHLSNAAQATPDYDTPSTAGAYRTHTLTSFDPTAGDHVDGIFTLAARELHIDAIHTMLAPYAFQGSFSGGNADYGYTNSDFVSSFTSPSSYSGGSPWAWGVKPYIEQRTDYLRQNVAAPPALPLVFVNEAIAINETILADEAGQFEDFVELYNDEDAPVDVSGMYLSDDPALPRQWQIPPGTVIPAKGFLLVWCDDDALDGPLHANFKLGSSGETVALYHTDAEGSVFIDSLTFGSLDPDISFGRAPDGSDDTQQFCAVTPGAANDPDDTCFTEPDPTPAVYVNEWLASNDGVILDELGDADDMIELYNDEAFAVDLSGRFLTDDLTDKNKWEFPSGTTIPAKGYMVIWADDEPLQGPLHATFKLSAGGEAIGLFDRVDNALAEIDALTFGAQTTDVTEGRSPDGSACIVAQPAPSPGAANAAGPADLTGDGSLNVDDIDAFVTAFLGADLAADCDGNGTLNVDDIDCYVDAFLNPCP